MEQGLQNTYLVPSLGLRLSSSAVPGVQPHLECQSTFRIRHHVGLVHDNTDKLIQPPLQDQPEQVIQEGYDGETPTVNALGVKGSILQLITLDVTLIYVPHLLIAMLAFSMVHTASVSS